MIDYHHENDIVSVSFTRPTSPLFHLLLSSKYDPAAQLIKERHSIQSDFLDNISFSLTFSTSSPLLRACSLRPSGTGSACG